MTRSMPGKPPRIPPKWVILVFLLGALCAFMAVFFLVVVRNAPLFLLCCLLVLATYVAGGIGYWRAPRRQPGAPQPDLPAWPRIAGPPILNVRSFMVLVASACVLYGAWTVFAPSPAPEPAPIPATDESILEQGDSDFEYGNYVRALESFTPLATRGNGHAQMMLAKIYLGQTGVPRDAEQAVQWAQKSAAQNHPAGLIFLSQMYLKGDGVPKDDGQAMALVRRAVALDNAEAKAQLGLMIQEGRGAEKDPVEARKWIMASAKQGLFGAQLALGRLVLSEGTELGTRLPLGGDPSTEARLPPVSAAVRKAAENGDAAAQLALGRALYMKALSKGDDVVDAQPWLEKSAASGNAMAQFAAGALYVDGTHGVPYSTSQAQAWFDKGVSQLP